MSSSQDSQATTIFILGLLGLVLCQICGIAAWIMGNNYMRECALEGREPNGMAVAGRIMGMIASVLMAVSFVLLIAYFGCIFLVVGGSIMTN